MSDVTVTATENDGTRSKIGFRGAMAAVDAADAEAA